MTLAQNRLLPLSGNKHIISTFVLIIFFKMVMACGSVPSALLATQQLPINKSPIVQVDSISLRDSIDKANLQFKEVYDIALLLPLYLDSVNKYYEFDEQPIYAKSILGVDFYEGILLALEELKKDPSIKLNINVYDTRKSIAVVEKILLDTSFNKNDLIIGPFYNNTGRLVARYAKNKQKPMFAPFSPSTTITAKNPYYIMMRAPIERHCDKMFDFIKNKSEVKNIFIVHRDDPFEKELAEYFNQIIREDTNSYLSKNDSLIHNIEMTFEEQLDSAMLDNSLDSLKQNYVVVPSFNEAFANHALNQFHRFSDRHPIITFGMPNWENFHSIRIDNLIELNVHLSKDFILEKNNPITKSLQVRYHKKYKGEANQYVYTGYDIMKYIASLLKKYGTSFPGYITKEIAQTSITNYSFHYEMIKSNESDSTNISTEINYIENKHAYLLRFDNFEWRKVNNE